MVTPDKKTPVVESLFNKAGALKIWIFIKKRIPTQVFSCEYCEIFTNSFLVELFLFIKLLRDDRILWTFWVIDMFHISCTIALFSFITLVLESGIHSYFLLVFIPKFLVNITFARTSTSAPALFWLNCSKPGTTAEP